MRQLRPNLSALVTTRKKADIPVDDVTTITNHDSPTAGSSFYYPSSGYSSPATPYSSSFSPFTYSSPASTAPSASCSPVCPSVDPCCISASSFPMPHSLVEPYEKNDFPAFSRPSSSRDSAKAWTVPQDLADGRGLAIAEVDELPSAHDSFGSIYEYDIAQCFYDDALDSGARHHEHGRASSMDQTSVMAPSKFGDRVPGFKRWMHRKNSSISTGRGLESPRPHSSRTSSITNTMASDVHMSSSLHSLPRLMTSGFEASPPPSPLELSTFPEYLEEPIDRKGQSSTPLLPPMFNEESNGEVAIQSPLQCPSVAEQSFRTISTISAATDGSNSLNEVPILSRSSTLNSTGDAPPSVPSLEEKWSEILGHANFTVTPSPYTPESCDRKACHQLFADWDAARADYFIHQARTQEHYGPNSKVFRLTEQKWKEIEAEWRSIAEQVTAKAVASGEPSEHLIAPSPFAAFERMPSVMPDGKFPQLGDSDIVGPFIHGAAMKLVPIQKKASNKVFGDWKFPGIFGKGI